MFCPHCGNQLDGTPKFCGFCGHMIPPASGGFIIPESGGASGGKADSNGFSQGQELGGSSYSGMSGSGNHASGSYGGYTDNSGFGGASGGYSDNSGFDGGASGSYSDNSGFGGGASGSYSDNYAGISGSDNYAGSYAGYSEDAGYGGGRSASSDHYAAGGGVPNPPSSIPAYNPGAGNASFFDGSGAELFGKMILLELLSLVTCSLATPWILVDVIRWRKRHTVINGRRLDFDGTASELFGHWIKWFLLSIVTCGIYAYFARIDYLKWEKSHTFYEGETPYTNAGSRTSFFDGTVSEYIGSAVLAGLITMVTCGFGGAWGVNMLNQYEYKGTCICGDRLNYTGTGGSLFGIYLVNSLLTVLTCGIYSAWATCALNRYIISNVHVNNNGAPR